MHQYPKRHVWRPPVQFKTAHFLSISWNNVTLYNLIFLYLRYFSDQLIISPFFSFSLEQMIFNTYYPDSSTSETVTAPMWQPLTPTDDERPSTRRRRHAAPLQTMQPLTLADAARTFTLKRLPPGLALHLPRAIFFYQDGVISVRQPPVVLEAVPYWAF